jgi:hypothetical protein
MSRETPAAVPVGEAVPAPTTAAVAAAAPHPDAESCSEGSFAVTNAVAIPENAAHASQVALHLVCLVEPSLTLGRGRSNDCLHVEPHLIIMLAGSVNHLKQFACNSTAR